MDGRLHATAATGDRSRLLGRRRQQQRSLSCERPAVFGEVKQQRALGVLRRTLPFEPSRQGGACMKEAIISLRSSVSSCNSGGP